MQAMIFAAGLGTRLRPLTDHRPKALVEVNGRPLLEHLLLRMRGVGVERVVVNVHHFASQIVDYLRLNNNFGLDIRVSDESGLLLDTGGGLKRALALLDTTQPVLVHNVDIVCPAIDLAQLYRSASDSGAATLVVGRRTTSRYLVCNAADGSLCGWRNVSTGQTKGNADGEMWAFDGIHVVCPELYDELSTWPDDVFSIVDFYLAMCNTHHIATHPINETTPWLDCGKPEALAYAARILESA